MNQKICDFAVIGGDMRQVYMARELEEKGYSVCGSLLCVSGEEGERRTVQEAVRSAGTVIAPVPLSSDRIYLNQKSGNPPFPLMELLDALKEGQRFFAGCIPAAFSQAAGEKGVEVIDFMEQEEITFFNTIATAEGAVVEAISKSPGNLHGSRCLVLGYGKCAQTLAALLKGMNAHVQVCVRNPAQLAKAAVFTEGAMDFSGLAKALPEFDFIFNTIPAVVMERKLLACVKPEACILDVASAPGGVDFEAAEEMGIPAWLLPGLPGKYAPASSAEELVRFVLRTKGKTDAIIL